MPKPRIRASRVATTIASAAFLAACSGGGGGGGGGGGAGSGVELGSGSGSGSTTTTSVKLAWADANGPVAGYSVYVQRNEGAFKHEADVTASSVTVRGAPGSTARVTVVAFDAARVYGPSSPTSPLFTFPAVDSASSESTTAAASAGSAAASSGGSITSASSEPASGPTSDPEEESGSALPGTLVWQAGDAFRVTDSELVTTRMFARPSEGAQLAGMTDFDADGIGDLLWVGATGQLGFTPGSALRSSSDPVSLVDLGALAAEERVLGAGDLDGDGDGDVLVASGDAIRARLTAAGGAPVISELGTASQAMFAGMADFDANGSEDVVWAASTTALVVWLMDGGNLSASVEVALPSDLEPIGVGDFDGNGLAEIALRGGDGTAYVVHPLIARTQLESTDLANTSPWTPVGDADLDGDGSDEIVLASAEAVRIASLPGDQVLSPEPGSPWQLVALLP